ncbi:YihY/virulence factor BrkB family protein [Granulibacter bethesdensis]|uniref:YihY/virulence factor BrkB family protein n=1 Tax=Granulibacter bethesdensis TaxID=364410 RepID=UPI0003F21475|nr:YihY/virulence factor BrkB family protein [Granulibacter bethesdensis]AHJ65368.1 Ribonuclease BN [Granulibacter bethesdensis CGDNIH4]
MTRPPRAFWSDWRTVMIGTGRKMIGDQMSLIAAGCAFYATLALFPTMTMLIFVYGLLLDPATIRPQLDHLPELLPPGAFELVENRIDWLVAQPRKTLGFGALFSGGFAFWSSSTGIKAMMSALNIAYEEKESRSFLRVQVIGLLMTLAALLAGAISLAFLVALPAILSFTGMSGYREYLTRTGGIGLLLLFLLFSISLLYRYGPCRRKVTWRWMTAGSVVASLLFVIVSLLVSLYIARLALYDATYGPLSAVVGTMIWFWSVIYAILLGAELNRVLELRADAKKAEKTVYPDTQSDVCAPGMSGE